jgi:catechol 2,3-dioxygenase-like lactoylglutathione lyase family enzyme
MGADPVLAPELSRRLVRMPVVKMRVARPTVDLARSRDFYERLIGLSVLWSFEDHDGFDGAVLGLPDERAQLELVSPRESLAPTPTVEDVLVLYLADGHDVVELADRLSAAGHRELPADDPALNPYWPRAGARVFIDPDGYRLVLATNGS